MKGCKKEKRYMYKNGEIEIDTKNTFQIAEYDERK